MIDLQTIKSQVVKLSEADIVPPPVLVYGGPGTGKTTTGKELATVMNAELKLVQCSRWNADTAQEIRDFCSSTRSNINFLFGEDKPIRMILLDEIDQFGEVGMNQLRPILDDWNEFVFFYATTNYIEKLPDAVKDRFVVSEIIPGEKSLRQKKLEERMKLHA